MCFTAGPIINQERIHKSWAFVSFSLLPIKRSEDINFSAARDCEYSIVWLPPKPPILLMLITVSLAINDRKPFNQLLACPNPRFSRIVLVADNNSLHQSLFQSRSNFLSFSSAATPLALEPPRRSSPASSCPSPGPPCSSRRSSPSPAVSATTSPWPR